jgi:transposase
MTTDLPTATRHPFYRRSNQLLRDHGFDDFAEAQCAGFYAETTGRPGLPPGIYFRLLLIGYFEGIDSERGIAWRLADLLALRDFLGVGVEAAPPDHSTISRTRRLIALETHRAVFTWVLQCLSTAGLLEGQDDRHRRYDSRSERRVSDQTRRGLGDPHADARGPGSARSPSQEESVER